MILDEVILEKCQISYTQEKADKPLNKHETKKNELVSQ